MQISSDDRDAMRARDFTVGVAENRLKRSRHSVRRRDRGERRPLLVTEETV